MPELPETETIARELKAELIGRKFGEIKILWEKSISRPPPEEFKNKLPGQEILALGRRGKYLLFSLSSGETLLIHLKMSGQLLLKPIGTNPHKHDRLIFALDDGRQLHFNDMRKFGRVYLVEEARTVLDGLGPEPLEEDFTPALLASRLAGRRGRLKPLLLNQKFLAGLGNIYVDEALFLAKLHPQRQAETLQPAEVERLHGAIRQVLHLALENRGTTFDGLYLQVNGESGRHQAYLQVYRRAGHPCPRCGTAIQRLVIGGRGTYLCPCCQF